MGQKLEEAGYPDMSAAVRPMTLSPDERYVYFQVSFFHGFVEYDLLEDRVLRLARLPLSEKAAAMRRDEYVLDSAHHGLTMNPEGTKLCAAGTMSDYAAIVSRTTFSHRIVPVGEKPYWTTNSGDGRYCFVSVSGEDVVSAISYETEEEVARIPVGDHPQRMRMGRIETPAAALRPCGSARNSHGVRRRPVGWRDDSQAPGRRDARGGAPRRGPRRGAHDLPRTVDVRRPRRRPAAPRDERGAVEARLGLAARRDLGLDDRPPLHEQRRHVLDDLARRRRQLLRAHGPARPLQRAPEGLLGHQRLVRGLRGPPQRPPGPGPGRTAARRRQRPLAQVRDLARGPPGAPGLQRVVGANPPQGGQEIQADAPTAGTPFTPHTSIWWASDYNVGRDPGEDTVARHEFAHAFRHAFDGDLGHFLGDVVAHNYLRHHSACDKTGLGFAFNEGWAEYWARDFAPAPSCPGLASDDFEVEGNVAAALTELELRCTGGDRRLMVDVLRAGPGVIHSFQEFRDRLPCPAPVPRRHLRRRLRRLRSPSRSPPPRAPPSRRTQVRIVGAEIGELRADLRAAVRRADDPPRCIARPCEAALETLTSPAGLRTELALARLTRRAVRRFDTLKEVRRWDALPSGPPCAATIARTPCSPRTPPRRLPPARATCSRPPSPSSGATRAASRAASSARSPGAWASCAVRRAAPTRRRRSRSTWRSPRGSSRFRSWTSPPSGLYAHAVTPTPTPSPTPTPDPRELSTLTIDSCSAHAQTGTIVGRQAHSAAPGHRADGDVHQAAPGAGLEGHEDRRPGRLEHPARRGERPGAVDRQGELAGQSGHPAGRVGRLHRAGRPLTLRACLSPPVLTGGACAPPRRRPRRRPRRPAAP